MKRVIPGLVGLMAVAVGGCTVPGVEAQPVPSIPPAQPSSTPGQEPPVPADPSPDPTTASAAPGASGTPEVSALPTPSTGSTDSPKAGRANGPITDTPFEVNGIPVVSKDHRLSSSYVPPWAGRANGLHPDASAAFTRLQAAAKADGLTLTIRSGYRSWSTQKASFDKAMREYDEKTARLYFAEAGASEHQLGLALDAWDGKNRGTAFARTKHAAWLAAHAHEFGFIIRYPQDKTHVTGYAWESWHLRWVGTEVSQHFAPGSGLTLEEYLGLA